ncbi:MAG: hypothetical protein WCE63_04965 [Acidobacteriaceae bacterium]
MTAEAIANLLHARPAGRGRWLAKCPAHDDARPSLSIRQGHKGALLRCWAGCPIESIMAALSLPLSALFDDAGLSPGERAEAARRTQERDAESRSAHHAGVERNRELLRLESLCDSLGGLLCRRPDDAEVGRLFEDALDKLRRLEAADWLHEDGPMRCDPTPESPAWVADTLHEFGQNFLQTKEKAARGGL